MVSIELLSDNDSKACSACFLVEYNAWTCMVSGPSSNKETASADISTEKPKASDTLKAT